MLFNLIFSLCFNIMATSLDETMWKQWYDSTFKKDLTSPTSFLNAYSMNQANRGESLYLVFKDDIKQTHWTKNKPHGYFAVAEHIGDRIRLKINDRTETYLKLEKSKREKEFQLPNGAIARVVYGRRNKKMWTYLFDPNQIKNFTGFRFYPYNSKAITEGYYKEVKAKSIGYKTVQGDVAKTYQIGNISFKINGVEAYLPAYSWEDPPKPTKNIALVFTDQTAGSETYGGGRELTIKLDQPIRDGQKLKIDFNKTVNFYCAHSPFWHCPVGLQMNIPTQLMAGEMLPLKKIVTGK